VTIGAALGVAAVWPDDGGQAGMGGRGGGLG
jgi:hypothetical protein